MDRTRLVAYCGLYCPKCYKNSVSNAALSLRNEMRSASLKDTSGKNPVLKELFVGNIRKIKELGIDVFVKGI